MVTTRRGSDTKEASTPAGISTLSAGVNCLNGSVGVGVLGLPFAFKTCGWSALLVITFVGGATYYTATVIVKVLAAASGKGKKKSRAELNYDALGEAAFGRTGQLLSGGVQLGELGIAAVAILCLLGDNLAQLAGVSATEGVLCGAAVSYVLSVTRPNLLAMFSLLSLGVVVAQVAVLAYFGGSNAARAATPPWSSTSFLATGVAGGMAAFGKSMFCFGGHSMLPAQYALMAAPDAAPRMLRRVFGFMWAINTSIGALGYALYGTGVLPKFVDNFPPTSVITTFIRAAMAYNLQSTVPLVVAAIGGYLLPPGAPATRGAWAYAAAVKGALLVGIAAASIFLGDGFDLVMTVGGASVVSSVALIFPLTVNLALYRHAMGVAEVGANVGLLVLGAAFAAWGTWSGLTEVGLL